MLAARSTTRFIAIACAATLLAGCATYQAVGMYQGRDDVMVGTVNADLAAGGSHFTLLGQRTGLSCEGTSDVSEMSMSLTCQGQSGNVFATCNDGTVLHGRWYATSCTTGIGYGVDSAGNRLTFKFGLSQGQVNAEVAKDDRILAELEAKRAQERKDQKRRAQQALPPAVVPQQPRRPVPTINPDTREQAL